MSIFYNNVIIEIVNNPKISIDSFTITNENEICDVNNPPTYRRSLMELRLGILFIKIDGFKEDAYQVARIIMLLTEYYNCHDNRYIYNYDIRNIEKEEDIETVFKEFHKKGITHIFGGISGMYIDKVIPYLKLYNMQLWYIGLHYNITECTTNMYYFYI